MKMKMKLKIFQRGFNYSQDGPGNRLVYHLVGCNMKCPWCANPEGMKPQNKGTEYSIADIISEVKRSRPMFFDGGGVTLTGGEPTIQFEALHDLLHQLKSSQIHTAIETNGTSPKLPQLFPDLDFLIMDLKHYSSEQCKGTTGIGNEQTIANIREALAYNIPFLLRIPLIGGFNGSPEDAENFALLLHSLGFPGHSAKLELLPYHEYGKQKWEALEWQYQMTESAFISDKQFESIKSIFTAHQIELTRT